MLLSVTVLWSLFFFYLTLVKDQWQSISAYYLAICSDRSISDYHSIYSISRHNCKCVITETKTDWRLKLITLFYSFCLNWNFRALHLSCVRLTLLKVNWLVLGACKRSETAVSLCLMERGNTLVSLCLWSLSGGCGSVTARTRMGSDWLKIELRLKDFPFPINFTPKLLWSCRFCHKHSAVGRAVTHALYQSIR